ncbi:MAG TPA: response regulator transcription factor [Bacteroidales bacterium]|nr:response regulator transcription factor [Bacteroidales bacterium]
MKRFRVFLLEDDINFGGVLRSYLEMKEFTVQWETDGATALERFHAGETDLCILDVMLPNMDGFSVAVGIRKQCPSVPLVFLTARSLKEDVLRGYSIGADDYICKPFDTEVMLMKLRAIRRRGGETSDEGRFQLGSFTFEFATRTLQGSAGPSRLSPREADLLKLLCLHINELMPRELALQTIWREDNYFTRRSMDVFIARLRKLLEPETRLELISVHGSGYRLILHG